MQISRDYLSSATSMTSVGRRYDFLSRVILDVKVQHGTAADQLESPERIAALVEAERLLREVTELFEQRFE